MTATPPLLFGPYAAPPFKYGDAVIDEAHGEVRVVGLSAAPIPWPLCRRPHRARPVLVLCGALAEAVRRESVRAVAYWWGVPHCAARRWRKALGVGRANEGTSRLWAAAASRPDSLTTLARGREKARSAAARAKKAAARRGRPAPPHVLEAMRQARLGKPRSAEVRAKISATHRRLDARPPHSGAPWTAEEDALLHLPAEEVAERTGRSLMAVQVRKSKLKRRGGRTEAASLV
jgi:hypothetical protein